MKNALLTDRGVLAKEIHGTIMMPGDPDYDESRKLYNAMIDRYPGIIVQCAGSTDVVAAVKFARKNNLDVAIRSGGHNGAGLAFCNDGLVIDLSQMKL